MKKIIPIIILFLLFLPLISAKVEIKEFVNDYAGIIDAGTEQQLDSILKDIYDSGEAEYAIVTVKSLEGVAIESYSLELAQGNLGDSEKNNGLLLLIALDEREYRFEVGRGIEYILNDAKVGRIGRYYLVPNFKNEDYSKAVLEASLAVRSTLLGDTDSQFYVEESDETTEKLVSAVFAIVVILLVMGINALIFLARRKNKGKYHDAALGAVILFGGRGGSRGGGFGGFGGGGFGGGGASGGW